MQLQYIGARYVPVWYVNTDDQSADWQPNVEYEPLTFVTTSNNHLYLSKKEVPDTIGNPANNISYWLDMGVFTNAQIAQLQQEVDDLELLVGDLDDLTTSDHTSIVNAINELVAKNVASEPHIILLGDSYDAMGTSVFQSIITDYPDMDIKKASMGGASFANADISGEISYMSLLAGMTLTPEEKLLTNRIIIMGGYNEVNQPSHITAGVNTTVAYIHTNFPNAEIEFMPVGCDSNTTTNISILKHMDKASRRLEELGCKVYYNARWILINKNFKDSDGIHPNASGKSELKYYLVNAIKYKEIEVIRSFNTDAAAPVGVTYSVHTASAGAIFSQVNEKASVLIPFLHLQLASGTGRVSIGAKSKSSFVAVSGVNLGGAMPTIDYPLYTDKNLCLTWLSGSSLMQVYNKESTSTEYGVNSGESESVCDGIVFELDLHTAQFTI